MIEKVASETVPAGATWLGRRKEELGMTEQPSAAGFERTEFSGGQSKLEGAAYFSFFTWLVFATLIIYIPFACFYRPKGYLHD
jgi:POT family proton-dependent oligopeptide transporter